MDAVRAEWGRWRRLIDLLRGRLVDSNRTEDEMISDADDTFRCHDGTAAIVAETQEREIVAREALKEIRARLHAADQPMTMARAKAQMLRRVEGS